MRHFSLMARFNGWVNEKLYASVAALDDAAYRADRGLFFGSIHATLNHLLVVDRLWTGRVQGVDRAIRSLDQILHDDLPSLLAARRKEDAALIGMMDGLSEERLQAPTRFVTMDRTQHLEATTRDLLTGMFNHQTHHRGQIYAVLLQAGQKLPDIDLIYYLSEAGLAKRVA